MMVAEAEVMPAAPGQPGGDDWNQQPAPAMPYDDWQAPPAEPQAQAPYPQQEISQPQDDFNPPHQPGPPDEPGHEDQFGAEVQDALSDLWD